ncbi:hypothetical protein DV735_g844, partial [Chaetothyriales sp. CBS 134920]
MPVPQHLRLVLALLALPGYAIAFTLPSLRPNPAWTYNQAIRVHVARIIVQLLSIRRPVTRLSLLPGDEKNRFQLMAPVPAEYYIGCCSSHVDDKTTIRPAPVGATWYPHAPARSQITRAATVILHFHGGGYVLGDGRDGDAGFAARCLLEACTGRGTTEACAGRGTTEACTGRGTTEACTGRGTTYVVCPQYRLSGTPEGRFPAALQDGITAYAHLVLERGIMPRSIVVSGDSAGGNLALALLRYLQHYSPAADLLLLPRLPPPGNLWLWSPWLNPLAALQDPLAHDRSPNAPTDYTTGHFGRWSAEEAFAPAVQKKEFNAYIHPLGNPFSTSTPVFICAGECEVFLHDNLAFARQMQGLGNNTVRTFVIPNAPHDVLLMGDKIGFEAAARLGAQAAVAQSMT